MNLSDSLSGFGRIFHLKNAISQLLITLEYSKRQNELKQRIFKNRYVFNFMLANIYTCHVIDKMIYFLLYKSKI